MTIEEFSNEFDLLYNNIMSNNAPGLSEYEKSVFLTQAQESLILEIYNGNNISRNSFESTELITNSLNSLVKQVRLHDKLRKDGISKNSVFFSLPEDLWIITYESASIKVTSSGGEEIRDVIVKPITQDVYYSTSENPFRKDNGRRVLRLLRDNDSELISDYKIESYLVRYISRPSPIILEDISEYGVTINGDTNRQECRLNSVIHRQILERAVTMAKMAWVPISQ